LQVLAPHPLDDRIGVADGRRNDPGDVARMANGRDQHARQASEQGFSGDEVDRVEVPAVDHDVVGPRCDLADQLAEERMHAILHARQQP
jgi:hypothetical protein